MARIGGEYERAAERQRREMQATIADLDEGALRHAHQLSEPGTEWRQRLADEISRRSAGTGEDEDAELLAREREQHMAIVRGIPAARAELAEGERSLVHYARMLGISWDDIAAAIGAAADEARKQYGEPPADAEPF